MEAEHALRPTVTLSFLDTGPTEPDEALDAALDGLRHPKVRPLWPIEIGDCLAVLDNAGPGLLCKRSRFRVPLTELHGVYTPAVCIEKAH
jgi:hypothetical protein